MKIKGVKIGQYSLNLSLTGIVITDREAERHMTICYNILKNAIDIHVKCDKTKKLIARKLFPIADVKDYFEKLYSRMEMLIQPLIKNVIKVDSKWLARRDYYITSFSESDFKDIFSSGISIKKRKYVVDKHSVRKNVKRWHRNRNYSPNILNRIKQNDVAMITAAKPEIDNSKHKLILFKLDDTRDWYAIRLSTIERLFENIVDPVIIENVENELRKVFIEFNVDGLADEVGELVEIG